MIIQCDHCSAKFRMDDSKLAKGPVKVRCAKCKEVFVVRKDEEPEESFQLPTDFGPATTSPAASVPRLGEKESVREEVGGPGEFSFGIDEPSFGEPPSSPAAPGFAPSEPGEFDWQGSTGHGAGVQDEFDGDLMPGVSAPAGTAATGEGGGSAPGEFDFGDFPHGEQSVVASPQAAGDTAPSPDDFTLDFGEVSFSDTPTAETPVPTDFDFAPESGGTVGKHEDLSAGFGDSMGDFSFATGLPASTEVQSPAVEPAADSAPFGDFDFADAAEPQGLDQPDSARTAFSVDSDSQVSGEEFAPLPHHDDEVPPASLTTRKKRGSLFPIFVIFGAIMLLVALVGSGVYFFGGPKVFSRVGLGFLVEWYGQKGSEEGDVAIRNVKAEYVVNKEAGELFVVRGEALNNYKKPRASIQVKVALLGGGGSSLKAKTAFCGNPLSNEQLAGLPLAKIEEAMNNQFGDSLANLGVKPGNAIPFVVVMNEIPKEAVDYSVQVSGSTVATQ